MSSSTSAFFRSCGQVLSLLLVLAVGMQDLPIHTLVQSMQTDHMHHECSHSEDYCPTNPDGPCECDDSETETPNEPTVQSCSDTSSTAVLTAASPKWSPRSTEPLPAPQTHALVPTSTPITRSSQRMGDDVFHPPRPQANDRPGSTLQALPSA